MGRTCELILYAANMHGPRFHRRPALFHRIGALRQDVIDHANRIGRNVAVSPSPLHDGVHALAVRLALPQSFGNTQVSSVLIHCAACFPFFQPGLSPP
ncbi:hypothetical protein QF000_004750 [Paraburkholderia atlantica]